MTQAHSSKALQVPELRCGRYHCVHRLWQAVPEGFQRLLVSGQIEACQGAGRSELYCIHIVTCISSIGQFQKAFKVKRESFM